jgi:hypothetical protein
MRIDRPLPTTRDLSSPDGRLFTMMADLICNAMSATTGMSEAPWAAAVG